LSLFSDHIEISAPDASFDLALGWPPSRTQRVGPIFQRIGSGEEFEPFEPREFIAQSDKVIALLFERFRIKATGIAVDSDYMQAFTIKNGKVVQFLILKTLLRSSLRYRAHRN
jgi:ketosteroid isomerase-like protein